MLCWLIWLHSRKFSLALDFGTQQDVSRLKSFQNQHVWPDMHRKMVVHVTENPGPGFQIQNEKIVQHHIKVTPPQPLISDEVLITLRCRPTYRSFYVPSFSRTFKTLPDHYQFSWKRLQNKIKITIFTKFPVFVPAFFFQALNNFTN
jgi:hypothetical protein